MIASDDSDIRLVSGGYVFIQPTARTDFWDPQYHPETFLTASTCLSKQAPDDWMFSWCETGLDRSIEAARWAIDPARLTQLAEWMDEALGAHKIAWSGAMLSLETAFEFAGEFLAETKQKSFLVGLSIPQDLVPRLLQPTRHTTDTDLYSPYVAVKQGKAPAPGGRVLGYEILGYEYGGCHSWLCNNLVPEVCVKLGTKLNAMGFIDDEAVARKAAEHCNTQPTEPVDWFPWLVQVYDARGS